MSKDSYNYGYGAGGRPEPPCGGSGSADPNKGKKDDDWGSWIAIFILMGLNVWIVALPWLFIKIFGSDGKKSRQQEGFPPLQVQETARAAAAKAAASAREGAARAAASARDSVVKATAEASAEKGEKAAKAKNVAKKMTKSPKLKSSTATLLQLGGLLLTGLGFFGMANHLSWMPNGNWFSFYWGDLLRWTAFAVAGGGMLFAGGRIRRQLKRFPKYLAVMGDRAAVSLEEITRKLGYGRRRVEKDLECMMDRGFFGSGAYINQELGYFIRSSKAEEDMAQKRAAKAAQQSETPREAEEGYSGILRNIRRVNDRIADPVLSEKIDKLENITARIFKAVEEDPKKLKRIDTFLNYYLPTTQKLLDSYAEFESAGVEGENLRQAKERIEATMDSIIAGFAHQLDELYRADAMDVDSDIRVMETMLHRDTASVEQDFGLGGTATQTKGD